MDNDKYIGRLLDNRYEILEVIGTGGMAVVYKARCHRLNRLVAIKILKDDLSQDEEFRRRFHAESQAVAMLSHPNIMSVYDVSTTDEADYIVMELIDGITLKQYMEKKGVLNWKETLHFGMQIAKALEHAHSRGIVHRDIKPHNIMVLKNGSVKVTDFGIARIMSKSNTLTKEALGSVHYISPEQAKGGRVDARSDLYSLGVVMYEMMTGRPPYDGESPVAVAIQHINGTPPMPSVLNPNIPGGLEQIIMKAMEKDPAKRYASATEMLYDLEEFRKNPSILFDFHSGSIDDALLLHQQADAVQEPAAAAVPRTTAERMAASRAGKPAAPAHPAGNTGRPTQAVPTQQVRNQQPYHPAHPQRPAQTGSTPRPDPAAEQRRQRAARQEEAAESRNRTMTVAVVTCSAIAVIGIVIFLVLVLNGGLFSQDATLVAVPNLIGKVYDELDREEYPDVKITFRDSEYSDTYEEGFIIRQTPDAGDKVAPDTEVKVWVSMGPEATEGKKMFDLSGMTEEDAKEYLKDLNLNLVPLVRQEKSDDVEEGQVIRTDPSANEPLTAGQTVTIYVCDGPVERAEVVPNVIGMDLESAIKTLKAAGFEVYKTETEESTKEKNEVLSLSVEVNSRVDVTTEIVITVSSGFVNKKVPYVVGKTEEEAIRILNAEGFQNVTSVRKENSAAKDTVFEQSVTGDTKVSTETEIILSVSEGFVRAKVPAVTGMTEEKAKKTLNDAGFKNIEVIREENEVQKDLVFRQSISADVEIDTTTKITIYVSNGQANKEVTKNVEIALVGEFTEPYQVTVMMNGKTIFDEMVQPDTDSIVVKMTGSGVQTYDIYINKQLSRSETVDFNG